MKWKKKMHSHVFPFPILKLQIEVLISVNNLVITIYPKGSKGQTFKLWDFTKAFFLHSMAGLADRAYAFETLDALSSLFPASEETEKNKRGIWTNHVNLKRSN